MRRLFIYFLMLMFFASASACNQSSQSADDMVSEEMSDQTPQQDISDLKRTDIAERKIIRNGEISFETSEINKTRSFITQCVSQLKGYVEKEDSHNFSDRIEHNLVIRIPAEKFDSLVLLITQNSGKLDSKSIQVQDVTDQYIDIAARIKTKKELLEKYKELLKRATKVEEILNIEKEIGQLQSDIESIEGRMNYLQDKIMYSTLTTTYYQKTPSSFGFATQFGNAVREGWSVFLTFIIGIAHLWVFMIIGGIIAYIYLRKKKKTS